MPALHASGVEVKQGVLLDKNFKAEGQVNLVGAKIEGDLVCDGSEFLSKGERVVLDASSARVDGNVYFRNGFAWGGEIKFLNAQVGRDFQWCKAKVSPDVAKFPDAPKFPENAVLNLQRATVGTLRNCEDSWPDQGKLLLDGFIYDRIGDSAAASSDFQLGWLKRQPQKQFFPQPYEQLASVLRKMGPADDDWRKVLIEKNEEHARHLHGPGWLWFGLAGRLIGYGYRPWIPFMLSLIVILIGSVVFKYGYDSKIITPTGDKAYVVDKDSTRRLTRKGTPEVSRDYPVFNAFAYSLESFVPLGKLGISDNWSPNANRVGSLHVGGLILLVSGRLLRVFLWLYIISGWILSALWVGGITGLTKT